MRSFMMIPFFVGSIPLESLQNVGSRTNDYVKAVAEVGERKDGDDPLWQGNLMKIKRLQY